MNVSHIFPCLLLSGLLLAGCAATSTPSAATAAAEVWSEPSVTASAEAEAPAYLSQLQLIAENAELWMGDTELSAEPYFYAVTDLDQNGRLEILQSVCQGTGIYTYTQLWEVDSAGTALVPCSLSLSEEDSQPDVIADPEAVYYDTENDRYYYVFFDNIRNGAAEYFQDLYAVSLQEGSVAVTLLGQCHTVYTSGGSDVTVTYTDAAGDAIDEEQYSRLAAQAFASFQPMQATIGWTDSTFSEQLAGLTEAERMDVLEASWAGFSLGNL